MVCLVHKIMVIIVQNSITNKQVQNEQTEKGKSYMIGK